MHREKGEPMFREKMLAALSKLSALVQMNFPAVLKQALLDQAEEIDRLRAENEELRSRIINLEKKEL
jgi:ubiquinone biosynthesis protein UbiJ